MEKIRLVAKEVHPKCTAVFTLDGKKYQGLRIPYNPIYEVCHTIALRNDDPHLVSVLKILEGEVEEVKLSEVEATKKLAKQHFGVELETDPQNLARTLIQVLVKETIDVHLLDSLRADTICDAIEHAYDKSTGIEHEKVSANLGKYLEGSKKPDSDKNKIKTSTTQKSKLRYRQKIDEEEESPDRREDQKNLKPGRKVSQDQEAKRENKKSDKKLHYVEKKEPATDAKQLSEFEEFKEKRSKLREQQTEKNVEADVVPSAKQEVRNNGKNSWKTNDRRSRDDRRIFDPRRVLRTTRNDDFEGEKAPRDDRVLLGIAGETPAWWREHNRPTRLAAS